MTPAVLMTTCTLICLKIPQLIGFLTMFPASALTTKNKVRGPSGRKDQVQTRAPKSYLQTDRKRENIKLYILPYKC